MSRLPRAELRPAHPLRMLVAGSVAGALTALALGPYATGLAAAATTPVPTPSCKEWQTVTHLPLRPETAPAPTASGSIAPAATPTGPTRAVCRNAPPTPFPAPAWDPQTVVGGPALAATGLVVAAPPTVPAPPVVDDTAYLIADLDSGEVLAAKSPHAWLRPASTLKMLTALTLLPRVHPHFPVMATAEHVAAAGTRVGMIAGNPYPAHYLFDALLMLSANDAAYALADAGGGYEQTLALMNAKATELGAFDTVAKDPSGLDEDGQHTSAYDLALIARAAMQREDFRTYIVKRDAPFPGGTDATGRFHKPFRIHNINDLLGRYPGAIGIKPGRTNRAQHTFVGAATREGRTLVVTRLGSTKGSWKDTAALLDWGFAHGSAVTPVGRLVHPGEAAPPTAAPTGSAAPTSQPLPSPSTAAATGTPAPADPTSSLMGGETVRQWPLLAGGAGAMLGVLVAALALRRRRTSARRG